MSVDIPDPLAERLAAEAARLGVTVEELALEAIEGRYGSSRPKRQTSDGPDALEAFIGSFDSGDPKWASRDIHELRAEHADRKLAEGA